MQHVVRSESEGLEPISVSGSEVLARIGRKLASSTSATALWNSSASNGATH